MRSLVLTYFNAFQASIDNKPITNFRSSNNEGLLIYLTLEAKKPHSREALATLLWPDQDGATARKYLSQSLYQLNRKVFGSSAKNGEDFFYVTNETIQFNRDSYYYLDVHEFLDAMANKDWKTAVSLYTGELLAGFACNSAGFENWLQIERERYKKLALFAMEKRTEEQISSLDLIGAQETAHLQLSIEPVREEAHRQLMLALAKSGDRTGALAQFDKCFEVLEKEFGVEPSEETDALYEKIVTNVLVPKAIETELPRPPTSFIGRTAELNHIVQTLNRPDCKMLTLMGMGGVGKTRLAIQVAQAFIAQTKQKAFFVSMLGNSTINEVLVSMAEAVGLSATSVEPSAKHIISRLANHAPLLLILDNIEPVLISAAEAFIDFLNHLCETKKVRLLITSRYPLKAQQEWILPINGLTYPAYVEQVNLGNWQQYDALALFEQRARQARITFSITRKNLADLVKICQLLDGNALGLELAAAQVRHQTLSEVHKILHNRPHKLEAKLIDLPIRHRSLYTVLEQTWDSLSEEERKTFRGTAVFHNGFTRSAARLVLGDRANQLENLVEKSLLTRHLTPTSSTRIRYVLPELTRSFLLDNHSPPDEFFTDHAYHYLNQAIANQGEIREEFGNISGAWNWIRRQEGHEVPDNWNPEWLSNIGIGDDEPSHHIQYFKPTFFIGRENELSILRTAISSMMHIRSSGGIWTIIGEAGIGKSSLVDELKAEYSHLSWFDCICSKNSTRSFHPFRQWLYEYFGQMLSNDKDLNLHRFLARFDDIVKAVPDIDLSNELRRLRPFLATLIDVYLPDFAYAQLQPDEQKVNFKQAIKALVRAESLFRPVIIHIEDAHWIDEESYELVEMLLTPVADHPIAIILTARPGQFEPIVLSDVPTKMIRLSLLNEDNVRQIANYHLGDETDSNLSELLINWCGGNPFYTQQLLLYLAENGLVKNGKLVTRLRPETRDSWLPIDLHNLLVSRLQQLKSEFQEIVVKASTLGHEFSVLILSQMIDHEVLQQGLEEGTQRGLWQPISIDRYVFNHVLLRDAAYNSQFEEHRKRIHKQAAQAIISAAKNNEKQFSEIALHYEEANESNLAIANYLKAGDRARDNFFIREAHNYYSRGLALATTEKQKLALLLGREQVNHWLGNREQQQDDLRQLVTLTADSKDDLLLADVSLRQATYSLVTGEYKKAILWAQKTVSLAVATNNKQLEATAMHRWGRSLWQQGNPRAAESILKRGLLLAEAENDSLTQAKCLYDLAVVAYYQNLFEQAKSQLLEALEQFEKLGNKGEVIRCIELLGIIKDAEGNFEAALKHFQHAMDLCNTIDWPYSKVRILRNIGNSYFELGDYARSREMQQESLELSRRLKDRENEFHCLDTIGLTYQYEGNLSKAREYFEKALKLSEQLDNTNRTYCLTHLGLCLIDLEEIERATNYLYEAMSQRDDNQSVQFGIDTEAALAWLDLARGDEKFAIDRVKQVLNTIKAEGLDGIELPFQVFWQCYYILQTTGLTKDAESILEESYTLLTKRYEQIEEPQFKQTFINKVPFHQKIIRAWESTYASR